jgi:single-strand DNA-binding protein
MANSYNKIFLVGHLGRDAELRTTPQGKSVATASLAVEDLGKKDDQGKPTTEWYRVKVWGKQGEAVSPYMTKGKSILVEGRLSIQTWVDKDSKNRYTPEVSADRVVLLGGPGGSAESRGDQAKRAHAPSPASDDAGAITDDDIPF